MLESKLSKTFQEPSKEPMRRMASTNYRHLYLMHYPESSNNFDEEAFYSSRSVRETIMLRSSENDPVSFQNSRTRSRLHLTQPNDLQPKRVRSKPTLPWEPAIPKLDK